MATYEMPMMMAGKWITLRTPVSPYPIALKRGRGRPRNGFDKKEYDRQKAAERRAKKKANADGA